MKPYLLIAIPAMLSLVAASALAADPPKEEEGSFWMRKKLEYSEHILAGLAKEDYGEIAKNARSMNALSHMERWVRASLPAYRSQLKIFENANEQLVKSAEDENLDGAALAYVQLTLSCVNCHKVVRDNASGQPAGAP